jgi:hypothetical protein
MPPGGYSYFQKETRTRLTAPTLWYLAEVVVKHRRANNLDLPTDMDAVMNECEEQMCKTMPPGVCRDPVGVVKMSGVSLSMDNIAKGASVLFDFFVKNGRKKVIKPHANERGRICGSCPANQRVSGCTSCSSAWLRSLAEGIVGGEDTDHDASLHACAYCSCQLRALVWVPIEVLKAHTSEAELAELPPECWKKREIQGEDILASTSPSA